VIVAEYLRSSEVSPHDLRVKGAVEIGTRARAGCKCRTIALSITHASTRHFLTTARALSRRVFLVARRSARAAERSDSKEVRTLHE